MCGAEEASKPAPAILDAHGMDVNIMCAPNVYTQALTGHGGAAPEPKPSTDTWRLTHTCHPCVSSMMMCVLRMCVEHDQRQPDSLVLVFGKNVPTFGLLSMDRGTAVAAIPFCDDRLH
eukprot:6114120-Amphidinium_carterae.1